MRTVLSEEQVARMGKWGWGAVDQERASDGGVKGDNKVIVLVGSFELVVADMVGIAAEASCLDRIEING